MLVVNWTQPAIADLVEAQAYIEQFDTDAAHRVAQRIWDSSQKLGNQPKMGREGYVDETREWVVQNTPYTLVYRLQSDQVEILHVYHDRQNWR